MGVAVLQMRVEGVGRRGSRMDDTDGSTGVLTIQRHFGSFLRSLPCDVLVLGEKEYPDSLATHGAI